MSRGIDQFYVVLKDYKKLFAWAIAVAAVPFAAAFSSLSPPSLDQIAPVTAIAQLAVLILVFQLTKTATKRVVNSVLIVSFCSLFVVSLIYLTIFLTFTFQIPEEKARITRGFSCTHIAQTQYPEKCPLLGRDELVDANYIPSRLWTAGSITAVHVALISSWTASFMLLACLVGSFVVFQQRQSPARPPRRRRAIPSR